ncbi:hypothetical protein [Microbacterium testaceum]|uniref:hypothetical protein n=1 Tax=Microbacterium testaceum TaxID=2033 RepID=UPI002434C21C|nr:hypothetical protein [Microbacterium testaceum]
MTAPATREHRVFPVLTLPVFDLRVGDVVVGTDSEIIGIDAENPWTRRLTERHPDGQITHFAYDCADELAVHRRPAPAPVVPAAAAEAASNTGRLAGIRCPRCGYERAFVVQITLDVVMLDDGVDSAAPGQPTAGHVPVIDTQSGFSDGDPIQCHKGRGGCGHRGTVEEFRIRTGADAAG